jgi:hypothetical protein
MSIGQNMLLISSYWNQSKTIKLIPASIDCPYVEGIFDPSSAVMVLLSKDKRTHFSMLNKLDDNGEPSRIKNQPINGGDGYKKERKSIESFQEHYLYEEEDQLALIELFAINKDKINYKKLVTEAHIKAKSDIVLPETPKIELATEMPAK